MTFNILAIKDVNYLKLAINNINSYHNINKNQKFKLYVDNICFRFYVENKNKLLSPSMVDVNIIETDKY